MYICIYTLWQTNTDAKKQPAFPFGTSSTNG